jgi:hypothetical protein
MENVRGTEMELVRRILWQRVGALGLECFELRGDADSGWRLSGTVIGNDGPGPTVLLYEVQCDGRWGSLGAELRLRDDGGERLLRVERHGTQWMENGRRRADLDGASDLDVAWSPSTNTLPIRRLRLAEGESSGPLVAAWARLPELRLEPLAQEYRRLDASRYRYASRNGGFVARVEVDEDGLVVDYEGVWRRVGASAVDPASRR